MAIAVNQANSKLKMVFNVGLDENNKNITKSKTLASIKSTATNEDLYDLGTAVSDMQSFSLESLVRYEEYELVNEIE